MDPLTGRPSCRQHYCLYVTHQGMGTEVFCIQDKRGRTFAGQTLDELAKECAEKFLPNGYLTPTMQDVGTIGKTEYGLAGEVYGPVLPEEKVRFVKAYEAHAEKASEPKSA